MNMKFTLAIVDDEIKELKKWYFLLSRAFAKDLNIISILVGSEKALISSGIESFFIKEYDEVAEQDKQKLFGFKESLINLSDEPSNNIEYFAGKIKDNLKQKNVNILLMDLWYRGLSPTLDGFLEKDLAGTIIKLVTVNKIIFFTNQIDVINEFKKHCPFPSLINLTLPFTLISKSDENNIIDTVGNSVKEVRELFNQINMFIGSSDLMKNVSELIELYKDVEDKPILLMGERGTGKELVARALYERSSIKKSHLFPLNCAGMNPDTLYSEIFGHLKGSFTSAHKDKDGIVAEYDDGTIFLDEIQDAGRRFQNAIKTFIAHDSDKKKGRYRRLGENIVKYSGARLIVASNVNLIQSDEFAKDLYDRLSTYVIHIPRLDDFKDDIPNLIKYLLESKKLTGTIRINDAVVNKLKSHNYEGNIRALENAIDRLILFSKTNNNVIDMNLYKISNVERDIIYSTRIDKVNKNDSLQIVEERKKNDDHDNLLLKALVSYMLYFSANNRETIFNSWFDEANNPINKKIEESIQEFKNTPKETATIEFEKRVLLSLLWLTQCHEIKSKKNNVSFIYNIYQDLANFNNRFNDHRAFFDYFVHSGRRLDEKSRKSFRKLAAEFLISNNLIINEQLNNALKNGEYDSLSNRKKLFGKEYIRESDQSDLFSLMKGWDEAIKVITEAQNKY